MIKVLIVNDSIAVQQILKRIISSDSELEIVGIANDGLEAIRLAKTQSPDVILMDIRMPNCGGVEATRQIMAKNPCPILIVTATIQAHMPHIYECLNLGAMEAIKTPTMEGAGQQRDEVSVLRKIGEKLLGRIKIVASLKKQVLSAPREKAEPNVEEIFKPRPQALIHGGAAKRVVAIGASTGGPSAILHVLQNLPAHLDAALVLVQHIDASFAVGLAEWFDNNLKDRLKIYAAKPGDVLVKGAGFVACEDQDMVVGPDRSLEYQKSAMGSFFCPCVDVTFASVAQQYGKNAIGVLLTGMGDDGAKGLKAIRDAGGRTIAQDEESSLIYGMPKAAKDIGAAEFVLPLKDIAYRVAALLKEKE